jgi:HSP20 family protein
MFDDMDRIFEPFGLQRNELFSDDRLVRGGTSERGFEGRWTPQIEVFERNGQFVIRADLPGLSKDDVKVELSEDTITLQGERRSEHEEKKEGVYRSERTYGAFFRTIPLPAGVNGEDATASFNNGVLEISMKSPRKEEAKTRRIDIQEGASAKGSKSVH